SEILPLKLRAITCAPPAPVEKRSTPRCPTSAVRRLVTEPPMVSRSKSATVVRGSRSAIAPLWLSSSTMPPRPSSPSNRTSPVTAYHVDVRGGGFHPHARPRRHVHLELGPTGDDELPHAGIAVRGEVARPSRPRGQAVRVPADHADTAGGIDDAHRPIGGESPALLEPVAPGPRLAEGASEGTGEREHESQPGDGSRHVAARVAQRSSATRCRAAAANR